MKNFARKSEVVRALSKMARIFLCVPVLATFLRDFAPIHPVAFGAEPKTTENYYDPGVYDVGGNLRVGKCIKDGGIDFTAFLQAIIWSDSFTDSLVEPWNDVLKRNTCQASDILGLVQQRDKIRKQIRDAFMTCRNEKVPQLKTAYHKTVMEIHFARNVVTGGALAPQLADLDTLAQEVKSKYIDQYHWLTDEEFKVFANELKVRYLDRRNAYKDKCDLTSWKDVWKKMKEFYNGVLGSGLVDEVKKEGANIKRKGQKIEQAFGNAGSFKEWAKGIIQANVNNQSPGAFWDQFSGDVNKYNPFTETNFPSTTQGVFEARKFSDLILRQQTLKNEMSARFQLLYGSTSDSKLQSFIDAANGLNKTIVDSFIPLNQINECAKTMNKRQCK